MNPRPWRTAVVRILGIGLLTGVAVWSTGCAGNPLGASPAVRTVPLTVKTRLIGTEQPLAGVAVLQDGRVAGKTDAGGAIVLAVVEGQAVSLRVEKAGYTWPLGTATATVGPAEVWTFWLIPE